MAEAGNNLYSEKSERARWPPLARMLMSGEMSGEAPRDLTPREKIERWMVNEGSRRVFVFVFAAVHLMVYAFGFLNFLLKDNLTQARATFGITYAIARAAALVLHLDIALLLFPVCRTLISLLRQTPLNGIIQFDKNITFHKLIAWSIVFFSWVHTIAHWNNYAQLAIKNNLGFKGWLLGNFVTGPGWSGYVMITVLMLMVVTSLQRFKHKNFERFWYTHHLFIVFFIFWSVHGAFCLIKTDLAPFCFGTGVFWQYWMYGGFIYLAERIMREVRGQHKTYISKVIQHPSNVVELQIKKDKTKTRAGQVCNSPLPLLSSANVAHSTSFSTALRSPFGNTTLSRSQVPQKRTISPCTCVPPETSPSNSPSSSAANLTKRTPRARRAVHPRSSA